MIMDTTDDFEFEKKDAMDAANPAVQKWEALMWKYQKALPFAKPGEKWMLMEQIFQL
jgi:L-rhamnose mutarotase